MAESPVAILSLSLPAIYALVRKGMKDGPHALFRSRQTVSNIGGTMILRRGSTSMEPLKDDSSLPKHKVSAEYHAIAFGEPALDSSRKKGWIGTSDRGIYVQTEIKIETEPKWLELTGVDV